MKGRRDSIAARIEAEEEAGVTGRVEGKPTGSFVYWKRFANYFGLVDVTVYRLHASEDLPSWKEQGQRQVRWVDPADASIVVEEPGLADLLRTIPHAPEALGALTESTGRENASEPEKPERKHVSS